MYLHETNNKRKNSNNRCRMFPVILLKRRLLDSCGEPNDFHRRRGVVAALVVVMLGLMLGMTALAVDVGVMFNARADLQDAADAAAMAGVSAYVGDEMLKIRMGSSDLSTVTALTDSRSTTTSLLNDTFGASGTVIEANDLQMGWIDLLSASSTIVTGVLPDNHNAVTVTVRRTSKGSNGTVDFFFGSFLGQSQKDISATATAAFDDRVGGIDISTGGMVPFTISETRYNDQLANGGDSYGFDENTDSVTGGSDGIREIDLYPNNLAPGNFGLLNIGTPNQGVPALRDQIENGVTEGDLQTETGSSELTFVDGSGSPVTYNISGDPGLKASLESSIDTRVGMVIAFLLHDGVTGSGANSSYHITGVRFGRVMDVNLNGTSKGLWIQPVIYSGADVRIQTNAPSSGGLTGRIVLAR